MAYSFYRAITVDHTKVPATLTDFPVAVFGTFAGGGGGLDLRTVGNGGKVQNSNGYDIAFFSDSNLTTPLPFERAVWNGSTGQAEFHVKIPSLSTSADTTLYIAYGDSGIASDQADPTNVWDSNYKLVCHCGDGSSLNVNDSTSNGNNGSNSGAVAVTGQVQGGADFSGAATDQVNFGQGASLSNFSQKTIEFLFNSSDFSSGYQMIQKSLFNNAWQIINNGANLRFRQQFSGNAGVWTATTTTLATGTTYHVQLTYDQGATGNNPVIVINGVTQSVTRNSSPTGTATSDSSRDLLVGADSTPNAAFPGWVDELRYSNTLRSANWAVASYNNQLSPGTFYSIGSENATAISLTAAQGGITLLGQVAGFGVNMPAGQVSLGLSGQAASFIRSTQPFNSVLDDFNRADENPLTSALWESFPAWNGYGLGKVVSNRMLGQSTNSGPVFKTTYGADQEVYFTIAANASVLNYFDAYLRRSLFNTVDFSYDGYSLTFDKSTNTLKILNHGTPLATLSSFSVVDGDSFLFRVIGTRLSAYRKTSSDSAFVLLLEVTDSTYNQAGKLALDFASTGVVTQFDDFGGGEIGGATLMAGAGAFSLSGQTAAPVRQLGIQIAQHGFSLNTQPANFALNAPAESGSFALGGQSIAFGAGRIVTANLGNITLSGQPSAHHLKMPATAGSFAAAGQSVNLSAQNNVQMSADAGVFVLGGQAAQVAVNLPVAVGSFTVSGQSISFGTGRAVAAGVGNFAVSGQDAIWQVQLSAGPGAFNLTGQNAGLETGNKLFAAAGSFSISGQNIGLGAGMPGETGNFQTSGQDASFLISMPAGAGLFTLNASSIAFGAGRSLAAAPGAFGLTGQSAGFGTKMAAIFGAFNLTGGNPFFDLDLQAGPVLCNLTGQDANLMSPETGRRRVIIMI